MNTRSLSLLAYIVYQGVHLHAGKITDSKSTRYSERDKNGNSTEANVTDGANTKVKNNLEDSDVNPEEIAGFFEGDIDIPEFSFRNGFKIPWRLWTGGVVPYEFSLSSTFTAAEKDTIKKVASMFAEKTCIRFREKTNADVDYVSFQNEEEGCFSKLGKAGGRQPINLKSYCFAKIGTPIHEFMHALGIIHEHTREDRDRYVRILYGNVKSGHEKNFNKYNYWELSTYGVSYNYGSVMHYEGKAFSKNGKPTIIAKTDPNIEIGQRRGFSPGDVAKINVMYKCPAYCSPSCSWA